MRRWETLAALLAVVLASLSVVNIGGRPRPILAVAAILLIGLLGFLRLRAAVTARGKRKGLPDAYERALRIQEARERRFRR
ncbi:MAG: hypothetical protein ACXWNK_04910 [Vulcanimicrobiaceae bacterium]